MTDINLQGRSFLIVDDVRVTRIAINKLLKRYGEPESFHAENGHEAVSILQDKAQDVDCIIADFNMPVMHGLQMMKLIRTGHGNIRRDIPVIMVTGHGEKNLLGVALALDVNAFILKPANKETLLSRLQRVLQMIDNKERWIKPEESYSCIDVDSTIQNLLTKPNDGQLDVSGDLTAKAVAKVRERQRVNDKLAANAPPKPPENENGFDYSSIEGSTGSEVPPILKNASSSASMVLLNNVQVGAVLGADVYGTNNQKLVSKGQSLTQNLLGRMKDLAELGEPVAIICIEQNGQ